MADRYLHVEGFGDFPITESEAQRLEDGKSITINISKPPKKLIDLIFGEEVKDSYAREYTVEDMGFRPGRVHVDSVKHPNPAVDDKKFAEWVRDGIQCGRNWRYHGGATDLNYGAHDSGTAIDDPIFDAVDRPSHYAEGRKYEPIDVIEDWELGMHLGNATKYISRAGRKGDELEDLKKARWYIDRRISLLEEEE